MEIYFLKITACLALLLLFYKLLLEKENMHVFKRFYLLAALIVSSIIPFISFQTYVEVAPILAGVENKINFSAASSEKALEWIPVVLWSVYFVGVFLFSAKFLWNLLEIFRRIRENQKLQMKEFSTVLLSEDLPPHTFWSYIFLNKQKFEKGKIPKEVLEHEKAHAVQRHSLDILFFELLQVLLWFNPLIYLFKKAAKLNHEFLADRAVLARGVNTATYQELLLGFSAGNRQSCLVNSINYSIIKKRFTVMKTKTTSRTAWVKSFLLLPLLALLLYSFSTKEIVVQTYPTEEKPELQEKATPRMVAEYNKWAKHYLENEDEAVEKQVYEHMLHIYGLMTAEQRENSAEFPEISPRQIVSNREDHPQKNRAIHTRAGEVPPPPPPPAPPVISEGEIPPPPPTPEIEDMPELPPPPPNPAEHMQELAEQGAEFYFEGEKISGAEAVKIVKSNDNIQISVRGSGSNKPVVRITTNKY